MIYKFRSRATGDVIMLGPHGDHLLSLIGHPPAPKGIIEPAAMPAAMAALERAVQVDEAAPKAADAPAEGTGGEAAERAAEAVALRPRVWPMIEMMKRAHAAGEPIVWGV
jgi:hypothetical protein